MKLILFILTFFSVVTNAQQNTKAFCEAHHYSNCPEICSRKCIVSCDLCQDCDGRGSCNYEGKGEAAFDINFRNRKDLNRTPLMAALASGASKSQVEKLLSLGADLRITDREGNTPLLLARLNSENLEVIQLLIDRGADIRAHNKIGQGVVTKSSCGDFRIYEFWKSKGLSLSEKSTYGLDPVSNCLRNCNIDGLKYLVKQGVKPPRDWKVFANQSRCAGAEAILGSVSLEK